MNRILEHILPNVQKPARYAGGEYHSVVKARPAVTTRFALCYPDLYEIGMSNQELRILYDILNRQKGVWCERCFAPWVDMEAEMRREGLLLFGLESSDPISEFDIIDFVLGYEMTDTNLLNMLDLAGLPLRAAERKELAPLVIAGGTACYNPEPLAPFVDCFLPGESEEVTLELLALYQRAKEEGWSKAELLEDAAQIPGVYVPSRYVIQYASDGQVAAIVPEAGTPERVPRRVVARLPEQPEEPLVPSMEIVRDHVILELSRGCAHGCRFCQAGYGSRPVRTRSADEALRRGAELCRRSGYQSVSLSALSLFDHPELEAVCRSLTDYCAPRNIALSLRQLRAEPGAVRLAQQLQRGRKGSLTFSLEAGTQRLRDAIHKELTEEAILSACRAAFEAGWTSLKLCFMLGLPTETDADVLGIAELVKRIYPTERGRLAVSVAWFVPGAQTAFQWEAQCSKEEYLRRVHLLGENLPQTPAVTYHWNSPEVGYLRAVLSRGDRRLGDVLERAWELGARLDSWSECFQPQSWQDAFAFCGLDGDFYVRRSRDRSELLPWSMLQTGVSQETLWQEAQACHAQSGGGVSHG